MWRSLLFPLSHGFLFHRECIASLAVAGMRPNKVLLEESTALEDLRAAKRSAFAHSVRKPAQFIRGVSQVLPDLPRTSIGQIIDQKISSKISEINGALGEIRTPDPQIRSLVLYPAELRAHLRSANYPPCPPFASAGGGAAAASASARCSIRMRQPSSAAFSAENTTATQISPKASGRSAISRTTIR